MMPVQESSLPVATSSVEPREWKEAVGDVTEAPARRRTSFFGLLGSDWIIGLLFLAIDVISWIAIYGVTTYLRSDNFLVGRCEFYMVDIV